MRPASRRRGHQRTRGDTQGRAPSGRASGAGLCRKQAAAETRGVAPGVARPRRRRHEQRRRPAVAAPSLAHARAPFPAKTLHRPRAKRPARAPRAPSRTPLPRATPERWLGRRQGTRLPQRLHFLACRLLALVARAPVASVEARTSPPSVPLGGGAQPCAAFVLVVPGRARMRARLSEHVDTQRVLLAPRAWSRACATCLRCSVLATRASKRRRQRRAADGSRGAASTHAHVLVC